MALTDSAPRSRRALGHACNIRGDLTQQPCGVPDGAHAWPSRTRSPEARLASRSIAVRTSASFPINRTVR